MTVEAPRNIALHHRTTRAYTLRQVEGPGAPREIPLTLDEYIIGRSRSADVQIDSPELSRKHFLLKRENKEYSATDLRSRNGIYLNGVKMHSASLRSGDSLQIGNVIFIFVEGF